MNHKEATQVLKNFRNSKHTNGTMMKGLPGIGKDALVEKIFSESETVKKTGYITGRGLFDTLSGNPNKTIVLSDTYGWESEEGMSILKAAVDSKRERVITRDTKDKLEPALFKGKMIFLVNTLKESHHLDALKSRCEYIHLELSAEDFVKIATQIIKKEFPDQKYLMQFLEFMIQSNCLDLRKVTSYYDKIIMLRKSHSKLNASKFDQKWKELLREQMSESNGDNEVGFIQGLMNKKLTVTECKVLFTQKFLCSDRTFFRRWAEAKAASLN